MSVSVTDCKQWKASQLGYTDSTASIGGAVTGSAVYPAVVNGTVITNSSPGEWFPTVSALASGALYSGDVVTNYGKTFVGHVNASSTLTNSFVCLINGLLTPGSSGFYSWVSTSASDNTSKKVTYWADVGGSLGQRDLIGNGITLVTDSATVIRVFRTEFRNVSDGSIATCAGTISHYVNGILIGITPPPDPIT